MIDLPTDTSGSFEVTVTATDEAGNQIPEPVSYSYDVVDDTPPTVTIAEPIDDGVYKLGSSLTAIYSCADNSGAVTCDGSLDGTPIATGTSISTNTVGPYVLTVTATDEAGNVTTASAEFSIGYRICLLYDPDHEQPVTGAVPIKLQLCDAAGTNLSKPSITLTALTVDGTLDPGPNFSGNSNYGRAFRYNAKLKGYIYNLNVDGLVAGPHTLEFEASTTGTVPYTAPFALKE
jgi:hypothetical protein